MVFKDKQPCGIGCWDAQSQKGNARCQYCGRTHAEGESPEMVVADIPSEDRQSLVRRFVIKDPYAEERVEKDAAGDC